VTNRLWLVPVFGALLATLVTWLPMLARPGWVIPPYEARAGIDIWTHQALWFTLFTVVALIVGQRDTFLGLAVYLLGLGILLWGGTMDITHRLIFMIGTLALWAVRHIPASRCQLVVRLVALSGVFQALYVLQQRLGYDVLWAPGRSLPHAQTVGTLGTVDAATAYVAITAPLMPWWLLPLAIPAVGVGHSIGACTALAAGLIVRYHRRWSWTAGLLALAAGWAYWALHFNGMRLPETAVARIAVWRLAITDWWVTYPVVGILANIHPQIPYWWANPVTGNGPWWPRVAYLQHALHVLPTNENFQQAHNEWLQWGYEYGAAGLACLGGWLGAQRRMFRAEYGVGAALVAGAIASGSFFIFQVVGPALLMLVLVGLATRFDTPQEAP
jgi:hypothetical protein